VEPARRRAVWSCDRPRGKIAQVPNAVLLPGLLLAVVSPPVRLKTLLTSWQAEPFSILTSIVVAAAAIGYLVGVRRLARRNRHWSTWRTASFLAGVVIVVLGLDSGIAYYDDSVFYVHAIQHILLMTAGPVFLALGGPMTLWLQASSRPLQRILIRILHNPIFEYATNPILVASVSYFVMLAYFLSSFYTFSEQHPLVLDLSNVVFIVAGCLYWWPVIGLDPSRWKLSFPAKLGYLATGIPVTTFLGLALLSARNSIDPAIHTVADTHSGGGALWILGELYTLGAMGAVLVQLMHSEERAAARYDRRMDHERANLEREEELHRSLRRP
jgi:putative membrane protein